MPDYDDDETIDKFTLIVFEELVVRGFDVRQRPDRIENCVGILCEDAEGIPDPADIAKRCVAHLCLPVLSSERWGTASPTAGSSSKWLAFHEAGHVIAGLHAGLKADIPLLGVRFNTEGSKGAAEFFDPPWRESDNEALLMSLIAADVAGIVAETVANVFHDNRTEPDPFPSTYYNTRFLGTDVYPSDFPDADEKAHYLMELRDASSKNKRFDDPMTWPAKIAILKEGEATARAILEDSHNRAALDRLASALRIGPMTGTAVRQIVGEIK